MEDRSSMVPKTCGVRRPEYDHHFLMHWLIVRIVTTYFPTALFSVGYCGMRVGSLRRIAIDDVRSNHQRTHLELLSDVLALRENHLKYSRPGGTGSP